MDLVRCGRCGKEVSASAAFCRRCGCGIDDGWGPRRPPPRRAGVSSTVALAVVAGALLLTAISRTGPRAAAIEAETPIPVQADLVAPADSAAAAPADRPVQIFRAN